MAQNMVAEFVGLKSKVEQFYIEVESINKHINNFKTQIAELRTKQDPIVFIQDLKSSFENLSKNLEATKSSLKRELERLVKDLGSVVYNISDLNNKNAQLDYEIAGLRKELSDQKQFNLMKLNFACGEIVRQTQSIKDKYDEEIKVVHNKIDNIPKEAQEINKKLLAKSEESILQSSNAIKSSRIFDKHFEDLVKRIEKLETNR